MVYERFNVEIGGNVLMRKGFDYYYLVLLRHYDNLYKKDRLSYKVPFIMSLTLVVNLFSLIILFAHHLVEQYTIEFFLTIFIVCTILILIFNGIYGKERRQKLREKYEDESRISRRRGVAKVVIYEILSLVFLIWTLSTVPWPTT